MAALLEIDEANQMAVVQPGLTLAELDRATAEVGLVYPVFPGTLAAPASAATWPPTPAACGR